MDAFFAAVEQLDHPEHRGRPVIVGGLGPRGVVSTASYEARLYGVHSALPMAVARRLCPDGAYLEPRFERYHVISDQVRCVLARFSSIIEPISLDEAFFDLSHPMCSFADVVAVAQKIKYGILSETGLTCSVGLAPNRFLSKVASEFCKPDGFLSIDPEQIAALLDPLPVNRIWGVGAVTARRLEQMGILRVRDLRMTPPELLHREFGTCGIRLQQLAMGIDDTPLCRPTRHPSISRETTFADDLRSIAQIEAEIPPLAARVAAELVAARRVARVVRIKIRYADFRTVTRQARVPEGTNSPQTIASLALDLFRHRVPWEAAGIRLLGVGVGGVSEAWARQLPLLSACSWPAEEKRVP